MSDKLTVSPEEIERFNKESSRERNEDIKEGIIDDINWRLRCDDRTVDMTDMLQYKMSENGHFQNLLYDDVPEIILCEVVELYRADGWDVTYLRLRNEKKRVSWCWGLLKRDVLINVFEMVFVPKGEKEQGA